MEHVFKFIKDSRLAFIKLIDGLSNEQLNEIPEGFNNNIIWNFGHIVVSTQTLVYTRTGIREGVNWVKYVDSYTKGTKPAYTVKPEEVEELKRIAIESIEAIEIDYKAGLFDIITPYETGTYFATLNSIEDVLTTTAGHDNLHFGYAVAQKRIININN
ncbi:MULTISPECIES: DinB family protein [Sphingobacterium]|uniref:DinB family protein n=1 Tax=Sphingobacterium tenebrionis TaxID=3111775 RepID=A0ABU8I2I8_9SPHI|nr:DinB family protein [Sphingobacterium sp. CZ-2]QBR11036.1 DinB family protein [Sphingobacterium sp. CZ-2]